MNLNLSLYWGKNICIALSGGGDSVALLHYFHTHAPLYGINFSAVHCEHGIRGEESLQDAYFVQSLCKEWNVPLYFFSADCKKLAKENNESLETAARNFRYASFEQILKEKKADLIATAHHQWDNVETVLYNLCRGASLTGASGIPQRAGYIRPMLSLSKSEILNYLSENNLSYRHDKTNDDGTITRNALRLKILPELEKIIPQAVKGISRFSVLAREDDEFLYQLAQPLVTPVANGVKVTFSPKKPLFRRACLLALKSLGVKKDYTSTHLNDLYALQNAQNGDKISLPENVIAIREYNGVTLFYSQKTDGVNVEAPFALGCIPFGKRTITVTPCEKREEGERDCIDYNKVPSTAVFRTRRKGDVFTKFGGGTKKLKDYLIDKKIPLRERDSLVLLADGKEILMIAGVEISEKVKVEKQSKIIKIQIQKQGV